MRNKLIERRIQLGLTQTLVSEKSKISRPYYANIEAGRKNPSLKTTKQIAGVLKTTVDAIF